MRKKLITILLSAAMVITMAVPSFAGATYKKPIYVVIGDSISAGYNQSFGGLGYDDDKYDNLVRPYGRGRSVGPDGVDTRSIDFIKKAYPALVARKLGGIDEENSYNYSYSGYRAREFCYLMGLMTSKEKKSLEADIYASQFLPLRETDGDPFNYAYVDIDTMVQAGTEAKEAIKKASVISIQVGTNEVSALVTYISEDVLPIIMKAISRDFGISMPLMPESIEEADATVAEKTILQDILEASEIIKSSASLKQTSKAIATIICDANKIGINIVNIIKGIKGVYDNCVNEAEQYLDRLVKYCRNSNPNACIVVLNNLNPMDGAFEGYQDAMGSNAVLDAILGGDIDLSNIGVDLTKIDDILAIIVQPLLNKINKNNAAIAKRYKCTVADISKIKPGSMDKWFMHPTNEGHEEISEIIIKAIEQDCKDRGYKLTAYGIAKIDSKVKNGCKHGRTEEINVKEATLLHDGYTGDIGCLICGDIVATGEVIPQLKLEGTAINKLTAKKKSITASWDEVSDIEGYQLQYSTSSKFNKAKKATVTGATSKTVNKLKSGQKYYVRVRCFLTVQDGEGNNVKVYSKWSAKKSVTTK